MLKKATYTLLAAVIVFLIQLSWTKKASNSDFMADSLSSQKNVSSVQSNVKSKKPVPFDQKSANKQIEAFLDIDKSKSSSDKAYFLSKALKSNKLSVSEEASKTLSHYLLTLSGPELEHYVSNSLYDLDSSAISSLCRNKIISEEQKLRLSYILNKVSKKINFRTCDG